MHVRKRHPRLTVAACKIYGLTICLYPAEFRRAFGDELAATFRNRVEDVLDGGGILDWLAFAAHIAIDWIRTCGTLMTEGRTHGSVSLLGLNEGDAANGCLDRTAVDVPLVFVVAGFVLAFAGWYAFFVILPSCLT